MRLKYIVTFYLILLTTLMANNTRRTNILISDWRFEIGDNMAWADSNFDDSHWEKIKVPANWEEEGFPGYDGYAWYRVKFKFKTANENTSYFVRVGVIDDCDVTYINGHQIGATGSFPPNYVSAYSHQRNYPVPNEYLNFDGPNVIAIRVYDDQGQGGIRWGDIGIYEMKAGISPIVSLTGKWKFQTGDDLSWKGEDFDDSRWNQIFVPGFWQYQGYKDHLGFAWYRREFELSEKWHEENLILLLGKIDDVDETYLNGELLGKTGTIPKDTRYVEVGNWEFNTVRAYYIPRDILHYGGKNTIAVRVYDARTVGGIYEGPVGIITREQYLDFKEYNRKDKNYDFMDFLNDLF